MGKLSVPIELVDILRGLEPDSDFEGALPKVRSSSGKTYFAKIGSTSEEEQYVGETRSLQEIDKAAPGLAPKVVTTGNLEDGKPYMITEYKETGHLTDKGAAMLGKRLATELHTYESPNGKFGFDVPTFCGATKQPNGWYESWDQCFSVLMDNLLKRLEGKTSQYRDLCRKGEEIRSRIIPKLLGERSWKDSLIVIAEDIKGSWKYSPCFYMATYGAGISDWTMIQKEPFIFDPSSYFGHNEADLAIGRMFDGIPQSFFDTYHQHFPKAKPVEQYASRCDLYELYHYLNHTVLFGGGYAGSALRKMDKLLASW